MSTDRRAPSREMLLAVHRFPGPYVIKAFGPAGGAFRASVVEHAHAAADEARVVVHERATRSGDRVCVTVTLHAERVEEVEDVYSRLYTLPDLLLIL